MKNTRKVFKMALACWIRIHPCNVIMLVYKHYKDVKGGTDLAYFKHIFAAGNLNYGITEICSIFQLYHNSNFPLQKYAWNVPSVCLALIKYNDILSVNTKSTFCLQVERLFAFACEMGSFCPQVDSCHFWCLVCRGKRSVRAAFSHCFYVLCCIKFWPRNMCGTEKRQESCFSGF